VKYAIIIITIIILVRWETIVKLVDKTEGLVTSKETKYVDQGSSSQTEIVPVTKDKSFEQTPDQKIVALIEDFGRNPNSSTKDLIIEEIKANPSYFSGQGHSGYISAMSKLAPHIQQKNLLVNNFLFDLWPFVKGANLLVVKQLLGMNFEENIVTFIDLLAKSGRDPACVIAEMTPEISSKDDKERFLIERRAAIEKIINDETQLPKVKTMAINCFRIVEIEILKLKPLPVESVESPTVSP
jgi:hypothetical protein